MEMKFAYYMSGTREQVARAPVAWAHKVIMGGERHTYGVFALLLYSVFYLRGQTIEEGGLYSTEFDGVYEISSEKLDGNAF